MQYTEGTKRGNVSPRFTAERSKLFLNIAVFSLFSVLYQNIRSILKVRQQLKNIEFLIDRSSMFLFKRKSRSMTGSGYEKEKLMKKFY